MLLNDGGTTPDPSQTSPDGTGEGNGAGTGGRSPSVEDLKALEAAHRKNLENERAERKRAEERIAELENRFAAASAPPVDPRMARIAELQQRAPFDTDAQGELDLIREQTVTQLENKLLQEVILQGIPREQIPFVQQLVRQSDYRMNVADAARMARGTAMDSVEAQNKKLAEELERTKKELESARTRVPNTALTAVTVDPDAGTVAASAYNSVLAKGGPEALALMQRTKLPKGSPGHLDVRFGE
jgi:hypothetical protein